MESTRKTDFICGICRELLYKPITTLCGHNYCINCYENKRECPLCRTINKCDRIDYNRLLDSTIQAMFPLEYQERHEYFINMEEIKILKQKYLKSERRKLILDTLAAHFKDHCYICFTTALNNLEKILYDDNYKNLRYEVYHAWIEFIGSRRVVGPYLMRKDIRVLTTINWKDSYTHDYVYTGILYRLMDYSCRDYKNELISQLISYEKHCGIDNSDLWSFDSNPDLCLDEFIKSNIQFLRQTPNDHTSKRGQTPDDHTIKKEYDSFAPEYNY
jgi:hypothetical protein